MSPTNLVINMSANNSTPMPMTEFVFQAAVPKVHVHTLVSAIMYHCQYMYYTMSYYFGENQSSEIIYMYSIHYCNEN